MWENKLYEPSFFSIVLNFCLLAIVKGIGSRRLVDFNVIISACQVVGGEKRLFHFDSFCNVKLLLIFQMIRRVFKAVRFNSQRLPYVPLPFWKHKLNVTGNKRPTKDGINKFKKVIKQINECEQEVEKLRQRYVEEEIRIIQKIYKEERRLRQKGQEEEIRPTQKIEEEEEIRLRQKMDDEERRLRLKIDNQKIRLRLKKLYAEEARLTQQEVPNKRLWVNCLKVLGIAIVSVIVGQGNKYLETIK